MREAGVPVLDDEKLQQTTGFGFHSTVKGFALKAVASVQIGSARDRKNGEYEVWIVNCKNGSTEIIDPGDLWILHRSDLIRRLGEKGMPRKIASHPAPSPLPSVATCRGATERKQSPPIPMPRATSGLTRIVAVWHGPCAGTQWRN